MRRRREDGAAALEFGLVIPVILMMILGTIQYGYLYWSLQTAKATAREAARQLIVGTDWTCTQQEAVSKASQPAVGATAPTVHATFYAADGVTAAAAPGVYGGVVKVTVRFESLNMNIPFLPVPNGAVVEQEMSARMENVPPVPLPCT